ncbi:MAG: hypothetical protein HY295_06940 [Thaumarchaeota archaeon]|nr:hypothetical protein [Nitrososphaerota archaeon]
MQEIVLVLGSVAGACTAVAIDKIPKRKNDKLIFRSNPAIKNQVEALKIEKEILTKTISRLYQQESELSKIQRDKLLLRYQNQLGLVIAKIEKLEETSKHPDLGPLGDGLIILMDQKLSQLDKRLHELSSKITVTSIPPQIKQQETRQEVPKKSETKTVDIKIEPKKEVESFTRMPPIDISVTEPHKSVELITLTEIPDKMPVFPEELVKPTVIVTPRQSTDQKPVNSPEHIEKQKMKQDEPIAEIQKAEQLQVDAEKKVKIPIPIEIPEEEKLDDDDKDIDKIKSEIMKALSKLEQVEVE